VADLLDVAHIDAAMSLLRADTGLTVYPDAEGFTPPLAALPYVRVYGYIERPSDAAGNSLAGVSRSWTTYLYAHCVGANEYAALAMAMRVRAAWLDVRPVVAGRDCGLLREYLCNPPLKDETSGSEVLDALCVYRFTSN
jgi:hypothetical protein